MSTFNVCEYLLACVAVYSTCYIFKGSQERKEKESIYSYSCTRAEKASKFQGGREGVRE